MTVDDRDATERFGNRVTHYMQHRPSYPEPVLDHLEERDIIGIGVDVAELGSGTGIFAQQVMGRGSPVWAIEPNSSMRGVAEAKIGRRNQFHSVVGTAEQTSLPDATVDNIVAAQAFHWFDAEATRKESLRITRDDPRAGLVWNTRRSEGSAFLEALQAFIEEWSIDYDEVTRSRGEAEAAYDTYFGDGGWERWSTDHRQTLDWQGFRGRVMSMSYIPLPGEHEGAEGLEEALKELFDEHAEDDHVVIEYDTVAVTGEL
jgi:hypothetical protein